MADAGVPEDVTARRGGGALGRVTVATAIAAASGYLVLLLAARDLGADEYAVFAVFWAAYGVVTGAQNGQLQETTRAIRAVGDTTPGADTPPRPAHPLRINVTIGLALAAVVALTSPLWSGIVFDSKQWLSVALLACGVGSFAVYAHLSGALAGSVSWTPFAILLSVDALIRLAGAVVAITVGAGLSAFLVITVIGSVSWCVLLLCSSRARAVIGMPADVDTGTFTTHTMTAMAAATASAVLVMGFPVLISITGRATDDTAVVGATILAVTLTRAPLLVPLNSFQGVLIARFVAVRDRLLASLVAPVAAVVLVGLVGAAAAWAVGPWLMVTIFGGDYRLSGSSLALFTVGATALAVLTITGAAALSVGAHRFYAIGWWTATVVSAALLTVPIEVTDRVALALIGGPVIGVLVHLWVISQRAGRSSGQ